MWMIVMSALIAGVILLDQVSKILIVANLYEGQVTVIPGVLRFTYVENTGMAFGLLSDHRWVFLVLSTAGLLLIGFYLFRYAKTTLCRVSLSLIIGGGIGNMIDRIARGFVVDFIDFCAFPKVWYWVFNLADAAVTVGGVIFAVGLIFEIIEEYRTSPQKKDKTCKDAPAAEPAEGKTPGDVPQKNREAESADPGRRKRKTRGKRGETPPAGQEDIPAEGTKGSPRTGEDG